MTEFIPEGYMNIDQVIERVGSSMFSDWEPSTLGERIEKREYTGEILYSYFFIQKKEQERIKKFLADNHSNKDQKNTFDISICELKKSLTNNRDIDRDMVFTQRRWDVDLADSKVNKHLNEFYNLQEVMDKIRQALVSNKLTAHFSDEEGIINSLEAHVWMVDKNWHRLVLDRSVFIADKNSTWIIAPRGRVLFDNKNVEGFLLLDKKMDSSYDAILVKQLLKGIEGGTIKLRGAERLYFNAKVQFYEEKNQSEYGKSGENKGTLDTIITNIAKDMGLIIITTDQEYKKLKKEKKITNEQLDQDYVRDQEKKDIAKFIRSLHQQR